MNTYKIEDKEFSMMLNWEEVSFRIEALAQQINKDYIGRTPVFLVTLKGAMFFAVELLKSITIPCSFDCIIGKSYHGTSQLAPGVVDIYHNNLDLVGRDVIIVEDIVDTGYTIKRLLEVVNDMQPASVAVATLLNKPEKHLVSVNPDYVGFNISPNFIVGFGLDYNEVGRNLKGIYSIME
ncbi:MAG: hypoxanthine phosphoribosyltransferase [Ignavibacteria bacterium]|jgi:hypoxanthine phosphoribosyltransferase|nr:hypoxanthine phosphoribosyltransferase [Ignavibacteria bacterium]